MIGLIVTALLQTFCALDQEDDSGYAFHRGGETPISRADRLLLRQDVPSAITLEHVHRTAGEACGPTTFLDPDRLFTSPGFAMVSGQLTARGQRHHARSQNSVAKTDAPPSSPGSRRPSTVANHSATKAAASAGPTDPSTFASIWSCAIILPG